MLLRAARLKRLAGVLAVCSLLLSGGLPAAVVQTAAWAGMAARNLAREAPAAAVAHALDGRHECSACLKAQGLARRSATGIGAAAARSLDLVRPSAAPRPVPASAAGAEGLAAFAVPPLDAPASVFFRPPRAA